MTCPNLEELFGNRFHVQYEESYYAQYGPNTRTVDPWYMIIPCRDGHICPWGEDLLAYCHNKGRSSILQTILALPYAEAVQIGNDGSNVTFPVERLKIIATIVKSKRRRRLSPKQRAICGDRLGQFKFTPARQRSL